MVCEVCGYNYMSKNNSIICPRCGSVQLGKRRGREEPKLNVNLAKMLYETGKNTMKTLNTLYEMNEEMTRVYKGISKSEPGQVLEMFDNAFDAYITNMKYVKSLYDAIIENAVAIMEMKPEIYGKYVGPFVSIFTADDFQSNNEECRSNILALYEKIKEIWEGQRGMIYDSDRNELVRLTMATWKSFGPLLGYTQRIAQSFQEIPL